MPELLCPTILAFLLAGSIAYWELVTSKYPRTVFLTFRCPHIYAYSFVYAAAAVIIMLTYEAIVPHNGSRSSFSGNPWVRAWAIGLFTKSFLHFKIFTVPGHPEPTPIGLETIMLMFVPYLLREIELGHDRRELQFVKGRVESLSLEVVSKAIQDHLPVAMAKRDQQGFLASVKKSKDGIRAARLYLRLVGRGHFEMVFPRSESNHPHASAARLPRHPPAK